LGSQLDEINVEIMNAVVYLSRLLAGSMTCALRLDELGRKYDSLPYIIIRKKA
jgi:hypothetical protein